MAESMSLNITWDLIQGSNVFCVWAFPGVYVYPGEQGHTWRSQWAVNTEHLLEENFLFDHLVDPKTPV